MTILVLYHMVIFGMKSKCVIGKIMDINWFIINMREFLDRSTSFHLQNIWDCHHFKWWRISHVLRYIWGILQNKRTWQDLCPPGIPLWRMQDKVLMGLENCFGDFGIEILKKTLLHTWMILVIIVHLWVTFPRRKWLLWWRWECEMPPLSIQLQYSTIDIIN